MSKNKGFTGLSGKIGGLAVKGMIADVEAKMAAGEVIDTGPANAAEAEHLQHVRSANQKSGLSQ